MGAWVMLVSHVQTSSLLLDYSAAHLGYLFSLRERLWCFLSYGARSKCSECKTDILLTRMTSYQRP